MKESSYKNIAIWNEIPKYLPEANRLDEGIDLQERFWDWDGHKIHIDHYVRPGSKVKVIMLHGVGGNGRLLAFMGVPLYRNGFEVIAPDLPGYGLSKISGIASYGQWVKLVDDLLNDEKQKDDRPIVIFGLSAGGMLAYHGACINKKVSGVIVTNLLDQRIQAVRDGSATNKVISRMGLPVLSLLSRINDGIKLPMKAVANMSAIVNNDSFLKLLIKDKTSSGSSVPLRLILSLVNATPAIEPEEFEICPLLMVHPEKDRWTPVELSRLFFDRLKCKKEMVMLKNAGHFPIEQPGLQQLEDSVIGFLNSMKQYGG